MSGRTSWRRRHPWRFATVFAFLGSLYFAVLPIWSIWHVGEWEALGRDGFIWEAFESGIRIHDRFGFKSVYVWHLDNMIRGGILIAILLLSGRWIAGRELKWLERLADPMDDPRPL